MQSLLILFSVIQIFLTVAHCKPSVNNSDDNNIENISDINNLIDSSYILNFNDEDDDDDDEYYGIDTNTSNVNTIEHLQNMGIQTNGIDLDILEDALLSVVSFFFRVYNSIFNFELK